jgi:two-component system response regulator EvgA
VVRLLVVDDVTDARALVRVALGRFGRYEVVAECADAASAIELARRHQPDGIILDVLMPGMSGLEALSPLRAAAPDARIVVWSSTAATTADQAVELGAAASVDKLEGLERLVEVLDGVFPE